MMRGANAKLKITRTFKMGVYLFALTLVLQAVYSNTLYNFQAQAVTTPTITGITCDQTNLAIINGTGFLPNQRLGFDARFLNRVGEFQSFFPGTSDSLGNFQGVIPWNIGGGGLVQTGDQLKFTIYNVIGNPIIGFTLDIAHPLTSATFVETCSPAPPPPPASIKHLKVDITLANLTSSVTALDMNVTLDDNNLGPTTWQIKHVNSPFNGEKISFHFKHVPPKTTQFSVCALELPNGSKNGCTDYLLPTKNVVKITYNVP